MRVQDLRTEKFRSVARLALGVAVLLLSARAVGSAWAGIAFPLALAGVVVAASAFGRLTRITALERELLRDARVRFTRDLRQQTVPRLVYRLLLAVAEADGRAGPAELELVRHFLLARFFDPVSPAELRAWDDEPMDAGDVRTMAASLRALLSGSERETVFFWGCLVAFADRGFNPEEHALLQQLATGLGLTGEHARRVFWHAKYAFLGGRGPRSEQARRRPPPLDRRRQALELLGLDEGATTDDVRRRHRELVKQFHPDRHQHLGDAAAQEAAERFREVQRAYELLTQPAS